VPRAAGEDYRPARMVAGVAPRLEAELVLDARAELGEAPHWDADRGELVWVDIMAGLVHRFDPATAGDRSFSVGQPVGAAVPRRQGGLALALRDGFAVTDEDGGLRWLAHVEADRTDTRMNDGACDALGRFWAGTMHMDECEPMGTLYRLEPDGGVERVRPGVTVSNGLGWSPDGLALYYVDSPRMAVEAFDFDLERGTIANGRRVIEVEPDAGEPDGLSVDAEGCIWLALWGGWSVRRYTPGGTLVSVVHVPAARVTSCAFGGPALDDLYITTARSDADDAAQPHAGGVFRVRPGVRGLPAHAFAG
jgi:sugar lactone lactonase YvrE